MAGSRVDLSTLGVHLPPQLILDSSVVIDWVAAEYRSVPAQPLTLAQLRARELIGRLQAERRASLITPTGLGELYHYVVKTGYRRALPDYRADLLARYPNVRRHGWEHLFKARSDLIRAFVAKLDQVRRLMEAANLLVLQPDDLGPISSGRTLDDELARTMERYELDSNDAAILVEARRAGVLAIASLDPDLRRAALDFDVYAWS